MRKNGQKLMDKRQNLRESSNLINYWQNYEKRCCSGSHKQCKILLKDHMGSLKIMSLYIYKDLRHKT